MEDQALCQTASPKEGLPFHAMDGTMILRRFFEKNNQKGQVHVMRNIYRKLSLSLVAALFMIGCQNEVAQSLGNKTQPMQQPPASAEGAAIEGTVISSMDSGGYTYVELDSNGNKLWIAAPASRVKVGDKITALNGSVMNNFESKSLNRTFETILFVPAINTGDASSTQADPHTGLAKGATSGVDAPAAGSISKAEGGYTVEELFEKKDSLKGEKVSVKGKVVKANFGIMGKNWFHIQDGTGKAGTNDIIITSLQKAQVGDVITAQAYLNTDKDLGSGYRYDVILEDASFTKE